MANTVSVTVKKENNMAVPTSKQQTKNATGVVKYANGTAMIVPEESEVEGSVQLGRV